jgi:hypothetical protein
MRAKRPLTLQGLLIHRHLCEHFRRVKKSAEIAKEKIK